MYFIFHISHSNAFSDAFSPQLLSFHDCGRLYDRRDVLQRGAHHGAHHGHRVPLPLPLRVLHDQLKSKRGHVCLDIFQASGKTLVIEVSLAPDTLHQSSFRVQFH